MKESPSGAVRQGQWFDPMASAAVTPPDPQPWMADAACKSTDPEIFFERVNAVDAPAKKVCGPCTVQTDCLLFAFMSENPLDTRYGWMGNTSPIDRTRMYNLLKGLSSESNEV
jgi:hypothetical protein